MTAELENYLLAVNWEDISKRLNRYAPMKVNMNKGWRRGGDNLPNGKQSSDFVNDAILQLYDETRVWDRQKCPDLYTFLKGVVRSLVSNASTGKENKTATTYNTSEPTVGMYRKLNHNEASPEQIQIVQDDSQTEKDLCIRCLKIIEAQNDDKLLIVFMAMADEILKPQQIAKTTGIEIKEVYNLLKRINRAVKVLDYLHQSNNVTA